MDTPSPLGTLHQSKARKPTVSVGLHHGEAAKPTALVGLHHGEAVKPTTPVGLQRSKVRKPMPQAFTEQSEKADCCGRLSFCPFWAEAVGFFWRV
ncbi:MAG: hypothetical protein RR085_06055 [Clostridia bacterium]